jgi:hypothetical protein
MIDNEIIDHLDIPALRKVKLDFVPTNLESGPSLKKSAEINTPKKISVPLDKKVSFVRSSDE